MKRTKVYLRAYFNQNLGDDIFINILAKRYPNADFLCVQSAKQLKGFPSNVKGVCSLDDRLFYLICRILKKREKSGRHDNALEKKTIEKCELSLYIIGSGFMEKNYPIYRDERDRFFFKSRPYVIGCNFGPYETDAFLAKHKKYFSRCKDVCFRDSYSKHLFGETGRLESDIVFSYSGEKMPDSLKNIGKYQVIAPIDIKEKRKEYIAFLKGCIEAARAEGVKTVVASFCSLKEHEKVCREIADESCILLMYPKATIEEMAGCIKGAERVVAVRYHSAILSMLYQRPVAIISYNVKTDHLVADTSPDAEFLSSNRLEEIAPADFLKNYTFTISEDRLKELKESSVRQFAELDKELKK